MTIRVRLIDFYQLGGFVVEVQTRKEHIDLPGHWQTVWTTEPYYSLNDSIKRAKRWVRENLPDAVD